MKTTHTIVISDVHLRSENCQAKLLLKTLEGYEYKNLIIVGDLIEDDRISLERMKMNWHQFQLVEYLRERLRKKNIDKKVIRVLGNHDPSGDDFINQVLGIESLEKYRWEMNGKKFCAIHGHQFDRIIFNDPFLSRVFSFLILSFQRFDTRKRHLARILDKFYNSWLRLTETVAQGAYKFAEHEGVDVVICGHTHEATQRIFNRNGRVVRYWNTGDWTGKKCSFITIDEVGTLELHRVNLSVLPHTSN